MRVSVEDVPKVELGTKGILIRVRDEQGANVGKLWVGSGSVRWAPGSTPDRNAKKIPIKAFVRYLSAYGK
jgi:hypothetical protein